MGASSLSWAVDTAQISPVVALQAVQWWMELRAPGASAQRQQAWQQWRSVDPEHEAAWRRIESVSAGMADLPLPLARATLNNVPVQNRRRVVELLTALVVAGSSALLVRESGVHRPWLADVRTAVGERRTLRLADGTSVELNTGSAVNIRFSAERRVLELVAGEVLVQTGQDALGRPFSVQTDVGNVRAIGTRFTVRAHGNSVEVGLLQGAVELTPACAAGIARRLEAGQQARMSPTEVLSPELLTEGAGSWVDGMLVVSGMRLDDFLAELGRYRSGRLGCDPVLAHLKVSGAYPLVDTDKVLAALTSALPVQVHAFTRYWVMLKPSAVAR